MSGDVQKEKLGASRAECHQEAGEVFASPPGRSNFRGRESERKKKDRETKGIEKSAPAYVCLSTGTFRPSSFEAQGNLLLGSGREETESAGVCVQTELDRLLYCGEDFRESFFLLSLSEPCREDAISLPVEEGRRSAEENDGGAERKGRERRGERQKAKILGTAGRRAYYPGEDKENPFLQDSEQASSSSSCSPALPSLPRPQTLPLCRRERGRGRSSSSSLSSGQLFILVDNLPVHNATSSASST